MNDLKTPCLILDLERLRRNAERMTRLAHDKSVRLRPHVKTHKSIEIGRIQTTRRDGAITVSTLAEARAFAAGGFNDITYAVPIEAGKFKDVIDIIKSGVHLNVITTDLATMQLLDSAAASAGVKVSVFLKVDCGYHRCGVDPNSPEATAIPQFITDSSNLHFAGILTHAGHSYNVKTKAEIEEIARIERNVMVDLATRLRADGIVVRTVSIGSTPSVTHVDHLDGIDEIRPGNYILFDAFQATLGSCGFEDCALTVLAAVTHISRTHGKIVIDAGAIAMSKDRGAVDIDPSCGYGRVLDLDGNELGLRLDSLSQEHGQINVTDDALFEWLRVGSRVRILANHSCLTAAQHSHYNVLENGSIVDRWQIHNGW